MDIVAILEKLIEVPLDEAIGYFICTLSGVAVNWLWKCKREGIKVFSYWRENLAASFGVVAGALAAFLTTIILEPGVGKATYFAIGIAADAMLNKPPLPLAVRTALARLETLQEELNEKGNVAVAGAAGGLPIAEVADAIAANAVAEVEKRFVAGEPAGKAES